MFGSLVAMLHHACWEGQVRSGHRHHQAVLVGGPLRSKPRRSPKRICIQYIALTKRTCQSSTFASVATGSFVGPGHVPRGAPLPYVRPPQLMNIGVFHERIHVASQQLSISPSPESSESVAMSIVSCVHVSATGGYDGDRIHIITWVSGSF